MNEDEFRQALHATMTVAQPPEPMNEAPVLDLAKRAERRRKAAWAGAGSAAAAVAVIAGAVVLVPAVDDDAPGLSVGESATTSRVEQTATAGQRYDQGVRVLDELTSAVPEGYEAPLDLVYSDPSYDGQPLRDHQAAIRWNDDWEYYAYVPVAGNGGVGTLFADVNPVPNAIAGEGCALSKSLWEMNSGTCEDIVVNGETLAVVTDTSPGARFDQWVGYRHPDGTVVYIAQDNEFQGSGLPPMGAVPMTIQQLAELATDARFHLD